MIHALAGSVVIAAAAAAPLAWSSNVLFADDFKDGDAAGWVEVNALAPLGGTTYDASGGRYEMESNATLPPLPFYVGDGVLLGDSSGNRDYRNCDVRFTVRLNNESTNFQFAGRGNPETPGAAYIAFNYQRELGIFVNVIPESGGATGNPPLAQAPFHFDVGRDYSVVVTMHGVHLTMKVWASDQPEPDAPQLAVNEHRFRSQSGAAFIMYNQPTFQPGGNGGQLSASFDDVIVTRGGKN